MNIAAKVSPRALASPDVFSASRLTTWKMHSPQKTCPHGVDTAFLGESKHIGHVTFAKRGGRGWRVGSGSGGREAGFSSCSDSEGESSITTGEGDRLVSQLSTLEVGFPRSLSSLMSFGAFRVSGDCPVAGLEAVLVSACDGGCSVASGPACCSPPSRVGSTIAGAESGLESREEVRRSSASAQRVSCSGLTPKRA